ncbi:IGR protein motif-domain-containing protein [Sphaerosporella brunnea]|uniref:Small ribosomal subunit protein mS41 n=1 Tax=Sphaerosporella brunnea TaxID=1250544 RepID=A0A5J5EM67_9PEZI|nr:IGR protein motif-domain-containing protein [Sphaerosporella brunnea]
MFALRLLRRASAPAHTRSLHKSLPPPSAAPPPTAAVPDVASFLRQIGRGAVAHAPKFAGDWAQLFAADSRQLKLLGVEPARARRYILRWRETWRRHGGHVRLCEHRRGVKIDGGERRRKEVRARRFAEERRKEEEEAAAGR